ncbi:MAG: hypothetical protein JRD93_16725 [Deltaproteobacteria bacterium]|nr:hypothetical protein [Deltaproteobacteria bacterium]MBW2663572.1 hypothetical protein [Deltaproteobacteria bacterium]
MAGKKKRLRIPPDRDRIAVKKNEAAKADKENNKHPITELIRNTIHIIL